MPPTQVIGWALTIAAGLYLSQAKTLADLVAAARHVGRGTLSAIGRCLPGGAAATLNVVIRRKKGLPPKRDESWFLMTDLAANAVRLTEQYARRMALTKAPPRFV